MIRNDGEKDRESRGGEGRGEERRDKVADHDRHKEKQFADMLQVIL